MTRLSVIREAIKRPPGWSPMFALPSGAVLGLTEATSKPGLWRAVCDSAGITAIPNTTVSTRFLMLPSLHNSEEVAADAADYADEKTRIRTFRFVQVRNPRHLRL